MKMKIIDITLYCIYPVVIVLALFFMYKHDGMRKERILNWARENNIEINKIEEATMFEATKHNLWEDKCSCIYRIETDKGVFYSKNGLTFVKDDE